MAQAVTWMEGQRSTSPRLPGGSIVGHSVARAFCGVVAEVSNLINLEAKSRPAAIGTIVGLAVLLALFVGFTRWGPVDLTDLRRRRAFGQLVRAARQLYGRHWRTMVPIGLTALLLVGGVRGLSALSPAAATWTRPGDAPAPTWRLPIWSKHSASRSPPRLSPRP